MLGIDSITNERGVQILKSPAPQREKVIYVVSYEPQNKLFTQLQ